MASLKRGEAKSLCNMMIWSNTRENSTLKYMESLKKKDEDPEDIVLDLAKLMEIDLTYDDIDITHRLNKGHKSPRPIIVRFSNYYSKEQMYRGRWKLRKKSGLNGLGVDPQKVYINENLTAYRAGLFKKVRDRRQRDWKF